MPFDARDLIKISRKIRGPGKVRRRATLIWAITETIREDWREGITPTLLNHEGMLVASLRSGLCLEGMPWADANTSAIEIVSEALRAAGAKRPTWNQGQPEWTDQGVIRDTRTRCAQCEAPLEVGQKTFCSARCANSHRAKMAYQHDIEAARAIQRLRRRRRAECATS
jgi:hypothetical protein